MYCSDCIFLAYDDEVPCLYCKAHSGLEAPLHEAENKQECEFHLTLDSAMIFARACYIVFSSLPKPEEIAKQIVDSDKPIKK